MLLPRFEFKHCLYIGVILLIIIDLWSKAWVFDNFDKPDNFGQQLTQPIFGEWLSVHCITNAGGIWGIGGGGGFTNILTIIRMIAVTFLILYINKQHPQNKVGLSTLGLLLAGALGNLYDNLSTVMPWSGDGEVRDFIMFKVASPTTALENVWIFDPFPIFNFADACISVGFVLLLTGVATLGDSFKPPQQ